MVHKFQPTVIHFSLEAWNSIGESTSEEISMQNPINRQNDICGMHTFRDLKIYLIFFHQTMV